MSDISRRNFNRGLLASLGLGQSALLLPSYGFGEDAPRAGLPAPGAPPPPLIFPEPREIKETLESFGLDEETIIALPAQPSSNDIQLARVLQRDLADRCGLGVRTVRTSTIPPEKRVILLGSIANPLVAISCKRRGLTVSQSNPGKEGYSLQAGEREVLVAGSDEEGAFYGVQSLRQLIGRHEGQWRISGVDVRDWPYKPFRGVFAFLPERDQIPFFKRFICDFMALYKFNKLILEFNAQMRFDSHPELAVGWNDFLEDLYYTRRERPLGPHRTEQDSADGNSIHGLPIEKTEVAEIVRWAGESHIEIIPQLCSLTHSYYLLTRHRKLAAVPAAEWPDTYCSSHSATYELLFDVLDEVIEVTKPQMIHIGHDEWRIPLSLCPCCNDTDLMEQFIQDVNKIHEHLRERNVRTAMWGDHFIESLRGKGERPGVTKAAYHYEMPGALSPEQIRSSIPKDIFVFNWFWKEAAGPASQKLLTDLGFEQVYGNLALNFADYARQSSERGVLGGAPSLWAPVNEFNLCKDVLCEFLGSANLLWGTHWPADPAARAVAPQQVIPKVHGRFRACRLPSETGDPVMTIPVASPLDTIPIKADVSSVIFLHHAATSSFNQDVYSAGYNPADTAALLGWYEVIYEDGFVDTVPIRYGVNILESGWRMGQKMVASDMVGFGYCYEATPVRVGQETFFSYEWVNPRFGKKIREIRLQQTSNLMDLPHGRSYAQNRITLHSISVVQKRSFPGPDEAQSRDVPRG